MSLKDLCINNFLEQIKKLPPLLKEEITGISINAIRKQERKKILEELVLSCSIVIEDVTQAIIKSYSTGNRWTRSEYTKDMDEDIYKLCVNISQNFIDKYPSLLQNLYPTEEDSDNIDYYLQTR
jgi:hypothetical protein